jgi:endonuclease III
MRQDEEVTATRGQLVHALLDRYPSTFAEDVGIHRLDRPAPLFRLLVLALLMSARIRASVASAAARALFERGLTTPARMAAATWEERTRILNGAGYARYDERTSRMLAATAGLVLERYRGDLRRLRGAADQDPTVERALLKECKGIGDVGANIFFREVQVAWPELYPFADERALRAAERLGLGRSAASLARLARGRDFALLVDALVRVDLHHAADDILAAAEE